MGEHTTEDDLPDYHAVACPHCGAGPGEPCSDERGVYPTGVHASRIVPD